MTFIVICPKCQKRLKVGRELTNAKLKCSACQTVFVGSTQPAEGGTPAAAAPAPAAPAQRPAAPAARPATPAPATPVPPAPKAGGAVTFRRAPQKNMVTFYVVIGLGVLLIPLAIGMWYLTTHTHYQQDGKDYGWISRDEALALKAEADKPKPVPATTPPKSGNDKPKGGDNTPATPTPKPTTEGTDTQPAQRQFDIADVTEKDIKGGAPELLFTTNIVRPDAPGGIFRLVGKINNGFKYALKEVRITVTLTNDQGQAVDKKDAAVLYIPSGSTAPYHVKLAAPTDSNLKASIQLEYVQADDNLAIWEIGNIETDKFKDDLKAAPNETEAGKLRISGQIQNRSTFDLEDLTIWVDVFDTDGKGTPQVLLFSEEAKPEFKAVEANKTDPFDKTFDCEKAKDLNLKIFIRAVGVKKAK